MATLPQILCAEGATIVYQVQVTGFGFIHLN